MTNGDGLLGLALAHRDVGDYTVVAASGDLAFETCGPLHALIRLLVDKGRRVIVDLDAVDFLDSAGLGVLIGGMKRARLRGGSFDVVCGQDRTLRLLRISGVDKALAVYPDLASLLGARPET